MRSVAREGKRIRMPNLELRSRASLLRHPRVGFIVPKYKHSNIARNQLKRRLREIVRLNVLPVLGSLDVVVRARPEAYSATFELLRSELVQAARRVG